MFKIYYLNMEEVRDTEKPPDINTMEWHKFIMNHSKTVPYNLEGFIEAFNLGGVVSSEFGYIIVGD